MNECAVEFYVYIKYLNHSGIRINSSDEEIMWSWNVNTGQVDANQAYDAINFDRLEPSYKWWYHKLCKWIAPLKLIFFLLALENRILIGDNFIKRGGYGPICCPLC